MPRRHFSQETVAQTRDDVRQAGNSFSLTIVCFYLKRKKMSFSSSKCQAVPIHLPPKKKVTKYFAEALPLQSLHFSYIVNNQALQKKDKKIYIN